MLEQGDGKYGVLELDSLFATADRTFVVTKPKRAINDRTFDTYQDKCLL